MAGYRRHGVSCCRSRFHQFSNCRNASEESATEIAPTTAPLTVAEPPITSIATIRKVSFR